MKIVQKKIKQRVVLILLLSSFIGLGSVSTYAKDKNKKRTVLFEDGWQRLKPVKDKKNTGNFKSLSLLGKSVQRSNLKWTGAWCNWTLNGTDGIRKRGVVMIANKQENDDWLISNKIDLRDCKKPVLDFEGYSKYGNLNDNQLTVLITVNYTGSIESTEWDELNFESFHKFKYSRARRIDLKKYVGENVVIAFRSKHTSKLLKRLARVTCLSKVEVKAFKK